MDSWFGTHEEINKSTEKKWFSDKWQLNVKGFAVKGTQGPGYFSDNCEGQQELT